MRFISLGAIAFMIQPIFTFCIYNLMDGDAQFHITQKISLGKPYKVFQATLSPGGKECCHYSNPDCSPSGDANDSATFMAEFSSGHQMLASCNTGGAISFHGTSNNPIAMCTRTDGSTREIGRGG